MASLRNLFSKPKPAAPLARVTTETTLDHLDVSLIRPDPSQPRKHFDKEELAELGQSLKTRQMQPIVVRQDAAQGQPSWVIIDGERRWRAAQQAGLETIQAIMVREVLSEGQILEQQLIANLHRADLKPVEQAEAYQRLMRLKGWTTGSQLAMYLHLAPSTVSKALALLDLVEEAQQLTNAGRLAAGTAYEISKAPPAQQASLAWKAADGQMKRAEVVAEIQAGREASACAEKAPQPLTESLTLTGLDLGFPELPDSEPVPAPSDAVPADAGLVGPRLLNMTGQDTDSEPEESLTTFTSFDAEVTVRFPRAATREEVAEALEGALEQAWAMAKPGRAAA